MLALVQTNTMNIDRAETNVIWLHYVHTYTMADGRFLCVASVTVNDYFSDDCHE